MYASILLLAVPAIVIYGLCMSTDKSATIRQSPGILQKRSDAQFE